MTKNRQIISAAARCHLYGISPANNDPSRKVLFRASMAFRNQVHRTDAHKGLLFRSCHYYHCCSTVVPNCAAPAATSTRSYTTLEEEDLTSKEAFSEVCFRANKLTSLAAPFVAEYRKCHGNTIAAAVGNSNNNLLPPSSSKSSSVAEHAADSLLAITSSPKFLHAVSELYPHQVHPGYSQAKVESHKSLTSERLRLHESFLKVTLWCLLAASSSVPSDLSYEVSSKLVQKAMDLAIRGEKLGLPPHIPLYNQLAVACGAHLGASAVLSVANSIQRMLFPSSLRENQPRLFDNCIRTMVYLGKYNEVIDLLRGLHEYHELDIGLDLAIEITQQIKYHRLNGMYDQDDMEVLMTFLRQSVNSNTSQNYHQLKQDLSASLIDVGLSEAQVSDLNTALDEIFHGKGPKLFDEDSDYEDEDEANANETIISVDDLESVENLWDGEHDLGVSPSSKDAVTTALTRPLHDTLNNNLQPHQVPNASLKTPISSSNPSRLREQYNKILYVRDSSWILPDIVHSILETTGDTELLYSRDFEEEVLRQLDEDLDDDDYLDEDDDSLFDMEDDDADHDDDHDDDF